MQEKCGGKGRKKFYYAFADLENVFDIKATRYKTNLP